MLSPEQLAWAKRIHELGDDEREFMLAFIIGYLCEQDEIEMLQSAYENAVTEALSLD